MPKQASVKVIETVDAMGDTHHSAVDSETSSAPASRKATKSSAPATIPTPLAPQALIQARRAELTARSRKETRAARERDGVALLASLQGVHTMLAAIDTLSFAGMASRKHLEASIIVADIQARIGDAQEIDTSSDAGASLYNDILALCALLAARMPTGHRERQIAALASDVRASLSNVRYAPLAVPTSRGDALRAIVAREETRAASASKRANEVAALLGIPVSTSATDNASDASDAPQSDK